MTTKPTTLQSPPSELPIPRWAQQHGRANSLHELGQRRVLSAEAHEYLAERNRREYVHPTLRAYAHPKRCLALRLAYHPVIGPLCKAVATVALAIAVAAACAPKAEANDEAVAYCQALAGYALAAATDRDLGHPAQDVKRELLGAAWGHPANLDTAIQAVDFAYAATEFTPIEVANLVQLECWKIYGTPL